MADDNANNDNTPQPIMETVEVQDPQSDSELTREAFVPEEISEETPEDISESDISVEPPLSNGGGNSEIPTIDDASFGEESPLKKYLFLGMGILGVILVFFLIFWGISRLIRGNSNAKVTLEYWGLWEDENVMKTIIADYTRLHPNITVKYITREKNDYRIKLVTRAQEGGGPDIFRFHNTWLPSIIQVAAPLPASVMSRDEFSKTFYPVALNDLQVGDSIYGIPLGIDALELVYNNQLFKAAGITSAPKTWDDIIKDADTLRVPDPQGGLLTAGIALGSAKNIEHFSDILGWMLLQNGADIRDLSSQEAVEVLQNYRQFAEPEVHFWDSSMTSDINAFIQGKVGMIIVPSWQILDIKKANPQLELKTAPLPVLPGSEQLSLATYWVEGVSKSSKHQKEAWEFLKYLSSKDVESKIYQEQSKVRSFGTPYSRVDLRDTLLKQEYIGPVLEQAPHLKSLPVASRTYDQGLNDEIITYLRNAVNQTEDGVSYKEAFTTAAKGISQVLEKYNIQ